MADSKANLYPIPLENARINLNKFDSEIRRYNGFNKLNSPCVGGGISPLLYKYERLSTSSFSSVYVTPKGDQIHFDKSTPYYSVRNVGDFNYTILEYKKPKLFELKKVCNTVADNGIKIIRVLHADGSDPYTMYGCYIYRTGSDYTLNTYRFSLSGYSEQELSLIDENCTGAWVDMSGALSFAAFLLEGRNCHYYISGYAGGTVTLDIAEDVSRTSPISVMHNTNHNQTLVFFRLADSNDQRCIVFEGATYKGIFSTVNRIDTTSLKMASSNLYGYIPSGAPYNNLTLGDCEYIFTTGSAKVITRLKNPYWDGTNSYLSFEDYDSMDYPAMYSFGAATSGTKSVCVKNRLDLLDGSINGFCNCFDFQIPVRIGSASGNVMSFCVHYNSDDYALNGFYFSDMTTEDYTDSGTVKGTMSAGSYVLGDRVPLGNNFYLLFNNNQFSGISGEHVLLTEWNGIDIKNVSFCSSSLSDEYECIFFRQGDAWYRLGRTQELTYKVINSQLVLNVDDMKNCYDFDKKEIKHFGICFNSVVDPIERTTRSAFYPIECENNFRFAAAVNEYKQEDNCSILLNPRAYHVTDLANYKKANYPLYAEIEDAVNFYDDCNTQKENTVGYVITKVKSALSYTDIDLIGLPYPTDTNGNVLYNLGILFEVVSSFNNIIFVKVVNTAYPLVQGNNNNFYNAFYMASGIENLDSIFVLQGQCYGVINDYIYSFSFLNGVVSNIQTIVNVQGMKFCGNTIKEAIFYNQAARRLYAFNGANVLVYLQGFDKYRTIEAVNYSPITQDIFIQTVDETNRIKEVIVVSNFGWYILDVSHFDAIQGNKLNFFYTEEGFSFYHLRVLSHYRYYGFQTDNQNGYSVKNIELKTGFYGLDGNTVSVNNCLYLRVFDENKNAGDIEVQAVALMDKGKRTEKTVYHINESDWDSETCSIYIRYQPKEQRGIGISFEINSPFRIVSMFVGSQADSMLIDKQSKTAVVGDDMSNALTW